MKIKLDVIQHKILSIQITNATCNHTIYSTHAVLDNGYIDVKTFFSFVIQTRPLSEMEILQKHTCTYNQLMDCAREL